VAHHGTLIDHLTCVQFKIPIIWWHVAIKAHLFFNFELLINEIQVVKFMANNMLMRLAYVGR
jgi:hypothetical protein